MDRIQALSSRLALAALALAPSGCATFKAAAAGAVTNEQIEERNKALDAAAIPILAACGPKGKPEDVGLIAVSAGSDGKLTVDAIQWQGTDESKACIVEEIAKAALPAWNGPTVSDVWPVGTAEHPAPAIVENPPSSLQTKLQSLMAAASEVDTGPTTACAQQNLPNEAYAVVSMRVFIFSDGKVVAATPWKVAGEGRDAGFMNCVRNFMMKDWKFDSFGKDGFTMTQVSVQRGIDTTNK